MIRFLRHSRLLALALALATPAFGGAWLQAVHPCPVDMPWLGEHDAQTGEHAGGHHGAPAGQPEGCHCVGSCSAATAAALATESESPALTASAASASPAFPPHADAPALRPSDRLPPATAPPLG
jgi:hypothetical protein